MSCKLVFIPYAEGGAKMGRDTRYNIGSSASDKICENKATCKIQSISLNFKRPDFDSIT